jgi:hypothetical protein
VNVAISSPVTDAVLTAVRTLGRPVGDAVRPAGPTPAPTSFYPYAVVYVGTTRIEGSLVHPKEDGLHRVQITCVGLTRQAAEALRDDVRALLLEVDSLDIDGYVVVWTEHAGSPEVRRDDDTPPSVFSAVTVVNVFVTPISGS